LNTLRNGYLFDVKHVGFNCFASFKCFFFSITRIFHQIHSYCTLESCNFVIYFTHSRQVSL
jgi:hypothetical protein